MSQYTIDQVLKEVRELKQLVRQLLEVQKPKWMNETEAMAMMNRGKDWLRMQRNGKGEIPATLVKNMDWKYINNRTPLYKREALEKLLKLLS